MNKQEERIIAWLNSPELSVDEEYELICLLESLREEEAPRG